MRRAGKRNQLRGRTGRACEGGESAFTHHRLSAFTDRAWSEGVNGFGGGGYTAVRPRNLSSHSESEARCESARER
eukprot:5109341-Prymnesium_polylepis.1